MATTDDAPVKVLYSDYRSANTSELEDWLLKESEQVENNEDSSVSGKNVVYEDPGERVGDGHDALWGVPPKEEPFHHSDRAFDESVNVRRGVLKRQLTKFDEESSRARGDMTKLLDNASKGKFESHSAMLQENTKTGSLAERVKKLGL